MEMKAKSRQAKRNYWLTADPNGPHMHRVDTYIYPREWQMFQSLRDSGNWTQREALEFSLKLAFLLKVLEGKISRKRLTEALYELSEESMMPTATTGEAGEMGDKPILQHEALINVRANRTPVPPSAKRSTRRRLKEWSITSQSQ